MAEFNNPKPNTQALSWFYGEQKKKDSLILKAKYQRNPIWSIGQKCFLIDSIISGCPIPQVVINIKTTGKGKDRRTEYEVVDGQQRLRAILEYMSDEWPLIATTAKSYPVSSAYKPHIGKRYSELPGDLQDSIWNYQLAVQELRDWDDSQIRSLFRRLNYVVEKLNKQELRHSQYFGEFVDAVEELAQDDFWDDIDFFTRRDSQRMKDIEFVSELFVILIDDIQEGQSSLDRFYADYDVVFPKRASYIAQFHKVLRALKTIDSFLGESRFTKKADFYALFAAVAKLNQGKLLPVSLAKRVGGLKRLDSALKRDPDRLSGDAARYYQTVIEGANKKAKRMERVQILFRLLANTDKLKLL
jgi:hypothetical protein